LTRFTRYGLRVSEGSELSKQCRWPALTSEASHIDSTPTSSTPVLARSLPPLTRAICAIRLWLFKSGVYIGLGLLRFFRPSTFRQDSSLIHKDLPILPLLPHPCLLTPRNDLVENVLGVDREAEVWHDATEEYQRQS